MHELSIAESILSAVTEELKLHPGKRLVRIGLRVGEMAAVDPDSLSFCFESVTLGTDWEKVELKITTASARRICTSCGYEFAVIDYQTACPACASDLTDAIGGDELDFDFLELEDDRTSSAQIQST